MCGIVGFINQEKNKETIIKKMADLIIHRGPDSDGYYTDESIALGFRRLAIIDLKTGSQPIFNEDKTKVIIFNGEIYNYLSIKEDLIKKGHQFQTETDTEVILHGYEEYQEKILNKLRGMFAFVIYDIEKKELFASRDFYGIKPFYYYHDDSNFMFASEIKAFLGNNKFIKELNKPMLERYLTYQYSVGEETFFKNTYKLLPGHYLKYKDNKLEIKKYYELEFQEDRNKTLNDWVEEISNLINESVQIHKISDVEVGSFLSSGVDSSLIATISNVDKTFTVGFNNKEYNEIDYAKELSNKINVQNINKYITKEEYFKEFPRIQYYMDEPLADPAAIALYFVANIASNHVKVALSGEGADEIFGGYNIYQEPYSVSWYYRLPLFIRKSIKFFMLPFKNHRGANFFIRRGTTLENRYVGNAFIFDNKEIKKLLSYKPYHRGYQELTNPYYQKVDKKDLVVKMQYIDFNFWLVNDILLKADKMSMANSLEVRVPYLDKIIIEKMKYLPTKYKVTPTETKYAFRKSANRILETKVSSKKKLGFPVPIRIWLKEEDTYQAIKKLFNQDNEFFNKKKINKLLEQHKNNHRDNSRKIWTIYTFLIWYQEYFIKN